MEMGIFRDRVREELSSNPSAYIETIASDSGIYRIANVDWGEYNRGYISRKPGRWSSQEEIRSYYANDFQVCAAELGYTQDCAPSGKVFELYKTTREIQAINISRLSSDIRQALYEVQGSCKWEKTHAFLEEFKKVPDYSSIKCVYAPSASGQALGIGGMCFVANPMGAEVELVATGTYEDWIMSRLVFP